MLLIYYLTGMTIYAFILFAVDKRRALADKAMKRDVERALKERQQG